MHQVGADLFFSPSDLNHFVECEHLIALDRLVLEGHVIEEEEDPQAAIVRAKGLEHERQWRDAQATTGKQIVTIAGDTGIDWVADAARTEAAMRQGAEVIYQAVFADAQWRGIADFLVRVDTPSALGCWSYEAYDTKLARQPKPYFVLQLCWYSEQIGRVQGRVPRRMHVVLGTGEVATFALDDFTAYYRAVRRRFLQAFAERRPTYPVPVGHCHVCGYAAHCDRQRRADDHLSLVAGLRRDQAERLNGIGIATVEALARMAEEADAGISHQTRDRLVQQARLQVAARRSGHRYELLPPEPRRGFGLLPAPSDGDMFFDIEGFPYFDARGGLEYLWGITQLTAAGWTFHSIECSDRAGEKRAFEQFIDLVHDRLRVYPDLHVYHYAAYETTAVKRLMGTYTTREAEVDDLLRRGVFVDLYQVVRQAMQVSHESYSLKRIREFFMPAAGRGAVTAGGESIVEFQRYLDTGDESILDAIRDYNAEDCESTRLLRGWLLERKHEAEQRFAVAIPWAQTLDAVERSPRDYDETRELRERLFGEAERRATTTPGADAGAGQAAGLRLLAHLLDYHRREAKPGWWAFFDRLRKSLDELRDDTEAIAGVAPLHGVPPEPHLKSTLHTLTFPEQEFKLREGSPVREPTEGRAAGEIVSIDSRGTLVLKRGPALATVPLPAALVAEGPVPTLAQRQSLVRIAESVLATADVVSDSSRTTSASLARDLLERHAPRISGLPPGGALQTMSLDEQKDLVARLDSSYLVIQGPPGSGKTFTGARLIVSLLARGARIAVTATSHKCIHNLLDAVVDAGRAAGVPVSGVKKSSDSPETQYDGPGFENVTSNAKCAESGAAIVAGTSWLFAREEMSGQFDYLFVDEAGQLSLADTLAMSPCARNVVLLGDPQQLPHVTQGIHPDGAGVSVLEHLLGGAATVPADRGIFLERTWRMHPDLCGFVSGLAYDGRLSSEPGCARQVVESPGIRGAGVRFLPVLHTGNSQRSPEEASVIAHEVKLLLAHGTFVDRLGARRPLTPADILVVAPYNMQVRCLLQALPDGVEVGTVDKFQGREAPIVFFSMASSSGDDVPRGLEFLFSRNRLNVAISRAKALAVLVCSPRLLETRCRSVDQMRLVNGLCAFAEQAAEGTEGAETERAEVTV